MKVKLKTGCVSGEEKEMRREGEEEGAEREERSCQEGGEEQSRGGEEEQQVKVKVRDTGGTYRNHRTYRTHNL